MQKGLAGILGFLVSCSWTTGFAGALDEEVTFAFESNTSVANGDLAEERARQGVDDLAFARGALKATMAGNTVNASNMTTYNVIESGAFNDAGGIISVIQNTGNNVIIQNLTDVNVTIMP